MTDQSENRITSLFDIKYPLVQAGMVWCSGWELASAVGNAGGLGLIGSGSMNPDILRLHIQKCRENGAGSFGVNVPLLYKHAPDNLEVCMDEKVEVIFTSAGNPATHTQRLKDAGIRVVHVVANRKFALKAQESGVDAIVAEGFEAGGHNGKEELTTMVLLNILRNEIEVPLIAAGGIGNGRSMLAAMILGAEGVQIGSRFVASKESSAHENFKQLVVRADDQSTALTLKELAPVRLLKNKFYNDVMHAYSQGAGKEDLLKLLGKGRSGKGMFEGDLDEGELEIGQIAAVLRDIRPAAEIVEEIIHEYDQARKEICSGTGY